jgi:hypothetical protein
MRHWLRHYRWWLAAACLSCAIGTVAWYVQAARSIFTRVQYEQIQLGMTRAEVNSVMAGPPRDLEDPLVARPDKWVCVASYPPQWSGSFKNGEWCDGNVLVIVRYSDGRVIRKELHMALVPAWRLKLRTWFPWLCERIGL